VFLAALYRAEREIAEKLKTLAVGKPPWPAIDVDKAIPWVEQRTKLALADSQKAALRVTLLHGSAAGRSQPSASTFI
jgi:exodeoxyribonuclease V alpha subunit